MPDSVLSDYINALVSSIVSAEQSNEKDKLVSAPQFISSFHSYMQPKLSINSDVKPNSTWTPVMDSRRGVKITDPKDKDTITKMVIYLCDIAMMSISKIYGPVEKRLALNKGKRGPGKQGI